MNKEAILIYLSDNGATLETANPNLFNGLEDFIIKFKCKNDHHTTISFRKQLSLPYFCQECKPVPQTEYSFPNFKELNIPTKSLDKRVKYFCCNICNNIMMWRRINNNVIKCKCCYYKYLFDDARKKSEMVLSSIFADIYNHTAEFTETDVILTSMTDSKNVSTISRSDIGDLLINLETGKFSFDDFYNKN